MRSKKRRLRRRWIIEIKIRGLVSLRPKNTKRMSKKIKVDDGLSWIKGCVKGRIKGREERRIKCWRESCWFTMSFNIDITRITSKFNNEKVKISRLEEKRFPSVYPPIIKLFLEFIEIEVMRSVEDTENSDCLSNIKDLLI